MTTKVAPWLQGLSDEVWEAPKQNALASSMSSASHNASSLRNSGSRIPRRSLSGLPSSLSRRTSGSQTSTQKRRNPLAPLSSNDTNTIPKHGTATRSGGTRSVSEASDGSLMAYGTVQQRSKSASPSKKQETMEWKRRLVQGKLGYGDQTDLFGPSGLENIFAKSNGTENEIPNSKSRINWLHKSDAPMPSSPPPWTSSYMDHTQRTEHTVDEPLDTLSEEDDVQAPSNEVHDDAEKSFRSDPFDLESLDQVLAKPRDSLRSASQYKSSPDKAFIEPTEDEPPGNRTISGQTELEQEDFSPVFISKHRTVTGQVDYAALDSHTIKQFQTNTVNLRHHSHEQPEQSSDEQADERSSFTDGPGSQVQPDLSFSENLPTGSPFPNLGKHIEVQRGGYSQYGSFKRRPLSPSLSTMANANNADASSLLSPIPSEGVAMPPAPTPPRTPRPSEEAQDPKSKSSGSPLKLFGAHDTFTNNKLLRRMSQLNPDGTLRFPAGETKQNEGESHRVVSSGSFGQGELDRHEFNAEITITSASDKENEDSEGSPGSEVPVPGSKVPLAFSFDPAPQTSETYKLKRKLSKHSTATSKGSIHEPASNLRVHMHATVEDASESQLNLPPFQEPSRAYPEGKRPPTSPFKSPTPKRRRTLHASELEDYMTRVNDTYHSQLQEAVSSRKRKDARQGESQITADPEVLALRKILRPRNPTPTQRRRQQIEAELREAAEEFADQEPEKLEAVLEQLESSITSDAAPRTLQQQAEAVASEVAAFTLKVHKPSGELGERKRSVTTQDFLDEAMMVMNLIRAKARPQSNLGSVEESDGEAIHQSLRADGSRQDESSLQISRPPSREHSTGWRQRPTAQTNARIISHLRRFEEKDERDNTDFIANSIASLQVDDEEVNEQVLIVDEQSNIRITGPLSARRKAESDSQPVSQRSQGSTLNTHDSNGTSTGRTIGTSSTRKSDNVGTLAPDAVAHLIGEQVGAMTFDKEQQRWIRVSKSPAKSHGSFLELPSNVTSDDDPFREISDLPVDEQKERRRISSTGKPKQAQGTIDSKTSAHDQAQDEEEGRHQGPESRNPSQETVVSRPVTRDGAAIRNSHSSSVPSRYTAFASSQQQEKVETRATSWSDEELARMSAFGKERQQPLAYAAAQAELQRRNGEADHQHRSETFDTITEESISAEESIDQLTGLREDTTLDLADNAIVELDSPKLRQTPPKPSILPSTNHTATRQVSLRRKRLTSRFNVDAHEHSELSFVAPLPGDRMMSLSLSVSRPISKRHDLSRVAELQSSPSKSNPSFILSDLPDFTIHEEDAEKPSERALATRLAHHAAAEVNDRYALAVKDLVKKLTDAHEADPYWEDLKRLDLNKRSLDSLYGLEDFCARVQDIDVSNNALTHLHGVPATIRKLNVRSNQLSSLTSWNHLMNLQYLDISGNQLDSLDGLECLIHLRELRADDNNISRLDGLFGLDGLLKLRLRRNSVQGVDFSRCQLQQLTSLDLSQNGISSIKHLDALSSLEELKLDGNNLRSGLQILEPMHHLTSLSARDCKLEQLDVSLLPNLQRLLVDNNRLTTVDGLCELMNLQLLSMRRQDPPEGSNLTIFERAFDVRTLRLSGNTVPSLGLANNFLSLRHLELASVGLQELPADFGLRMANLKTLNLDFNRLKDIRPLLNIHSLENLSVCGNQLNRLRKSVATFAKLECLKTLDLRENQITQGFYASVASTMPKTTTIVRAAPTRTVTDQDEETEALEEARYDYPPADAEQDRQHRSRLDDDTKLRRRVHEMLLAYSCRSLTELDGLRLDRATATVRDSVWDRLVELSVLRKSEDRNDCYDDGLQVISVGR